MTSNTTKICNPKPIITLLNNFKITKTQFCNGCKISTTTLNKILNFQEVTLFDICKISMSTHINLDILLCKY